MRETDAKNVISGYRFRNNKIFDEKKDLNKLDEFGTDAEQNSKLVFEIYPIAVKTLKELDKVLPKSSNDFLFADGKSESEKFEFQRLALSTAKNSFQVANDIRSTRKDALTNINTLTNFEKQSITISDLENSYNTAKNYASEVEKNTRKSVKKKKRFGTLFILLGLANLLLFGIGTYVAYTSIGSGYKSEQSMIQAITFGFMTIIALGMFIFGIVFKAKAKIKKDYKLDKVNKDIDDVKKEALALYEEKYKGDVVERINANKEAYQKIADECDKLEAIFNDLNNQIIFRYLPNVEYSLWIESLSLMQEGSATSYTEALAIAKSNKQREKERAEDIARENRRDAEQRIVNQELLASQRRAEQYAKDQASYAKDQAYYAKKQAEYTSDQTKIMEKDAKANAKYRDSVLRQNDRLIDEYKKNNE